MAATVPFKTGTEGGEGFVDLVRYETGGACAAVTAAYAFGVGHFIRSGLLLHKLRDPRCRISNLFSSDRKL